MAGDPVSIVEDFFKSTDPQIRMNAMTAYGIIGNRQSIEALVQVALEDDDPDDDVDDAVRERAEQELAALTDIQAQTLIKESLQKILNPEQKVQTRILKDPEKKQEEEKKKKKEKEEAYLLAGRLRSRGLPLEGSGLPLPEQLKLIYTTRSRLYPGHGWAFNVRTALSGLVAGLIGAVLALYIGMVTGLLKSDEDLLLMIAGVLAAPAMSLAAGRLVVPFSLQTDRREAALFEAVFSALWGLVLGAATFVVFLIFDSRVFSYIIPLILGTAVLMGAIRLGTLAGYGVFSGRRMRRLFQITLGTVVGLLLLGLAFFVGGGSKLAADGDQLTLIYVSYFVPLAFAIANGFARIDGAEGSKRQAPKRATPTRRTVEQPFGPVTIVEEYVRAPDPPTRLNALRTLVTLKNKRSIARVFEAALQDEDEQVRRYAEAELARLDDKEMVDLTRAALQSALAEKEQQKAAYLLAGQLRSRGFPIKNSGLPRPKRIRLAFSMRSLLYPKRSWSFRVRGLESGLLGGILGAMLATVFLLITNLFFHQDTESDANAVPLLIYGVVVALGAGLLAGHFAVPIRQHVDRASGVLIELSRLAFWTFAVAVLLTVLAPALEVDNSTVLIEDPAFTLLLLIPLIRAGTLFGYGAFTGLRTNRLAQATVGAAWGLLALTLWSRSSVSTQPGASVLGMTYNDLDILWLGLVPACFAVAHVFARIDGEDAPRGPLLRWTGRPLVYFFGLVLALPFLLALLSRVVPPSFNKQVDIETPDGSEPVDQVSIEPDTSYTFRVAVPGEIPLEFPGSLAFDIEAVAGVEYKKTLRNTQTNRLHDFGEIYEKGTYTVRLLPVDSVTEFSIFRRLDKQLGSGLGLNVEPLSTPRMIIYSRGALTEMKELFEKLPVLADTVTIRKTVEKISAASTNSTVKDFLKSPPPIISAGDWNTLCWRGSLVGLYADSLIVAACENAVRYGVRSSRRVSYRHSRAVNTLLKLGDDLKGAELAGIIDDLYAFIDSAMVPTSIIRETQRWIDSLRQEVNPLTESVQDDLRQLTLAMDGEDDEDVLTLIRYDLDQLAFSSDPKDHQEVLNTLATEAVQAALARNETFIDARLWNTLCWQGSLVGFHADSLVINACEKAVVYELSLRSESLSRDSRAVNRLLNWNTLDLSEEIPSIIEDLRAYVRYSGRSEERINERRRWIDSLSKKINPLTPETLKTLRQQTFGSEVIVGAED